jgi:FkbM family methyltransferase
MRPVANVQAMKFRNELKKFAFQRLMQRLGLRIDSAKGAGFSYDARNYPGVAGGGRMVIFDVGANIGQSAIWYAKSFPNAEIFSFEPFRAVYEELVRNVRSHDRIQCQPMALLDRNGYMIVSSVSDAKCQTGRVVAPVAGENSERISIRTTDSFAEDRKLDHIHILKTDTEGFDLEVLAGAEQMLKQRKISYVLAEATMLEDDSDHTRFSALKEKLDAYSFCLHGLYDLHHSLDDGRLLYCNALFRLKS